MSICRAVVSASAMRSPRESPRHRSPRGTRASVISASGTPRGARPARKRTPRSAGARVSVSTSGDVIVPTATAAPSAKTMSARPSGRTRCVTAASLVNASRVQNASTHGARRALGANSRSIGKVYGGRTGFAQRTSSVRRLVLLLLLAAPAALADDLTVTHISRLPELDYVWASANPTRDGWPAVGQEIVWRANVKNFSPHEVTAAVHWTLDGVTIARGTQTFAANATTAVDLPSTWSFDRHRLAFEVDAVAGEESTSNNRLEVFTDALSVGFWVEQSLYDFFRARQRDPGVGSTGWGNWA